MSMASVVCNRPSALQFDKVAAGVSRITMPKMGKWMPVECQHQHWGEEEEWEMTTSLWCARRAYLQVVITFSVVVILQQELYGGGQIGNDNTVKLVI